MEQTLEETQEATGYILNVLSIDFDIIMYPCIKLYNGSINGDGSPADLWKYLEHEYELEKFLTYDAKTLILLGKILRHCINNDTRFLCLDEHQQIVDDLKRDNNYSSNLYNVLNIDWHHDIFYRKEDVSIAKYFDKYDCSNWVGYLYKNNKLASYDWFRAPNSEPYNPNIISEEDREKFFISGITHEQDIQKIFDFNPQLVYLVKSPQWIPYKFHHLYELLKEIFSK